MNKRDNDVLLALTSGTFKTQRDLAAFCKCSLGAVNASVKVLTENGYLDSEMFVTAKGMSRLSKTAPKRAVLLDSQYGLRTASTARQTPTALLKIQGETLIERLIRQLREVGVQEIYVVAGFAKEQFEYLIDKYGVELLVNTEHGKRHPLHAFSAAAPYFENCYIVPCDVWCRSNPFRQAELYSWYLVTDDLTTDSFVRINRKLELAVTKQHESGNEMTGIAYITADMARPIRERLEKSIRDRRYFGLWEDTLVDGGKLILQSRLLPANTVRRIDDFEDVLELDSQMSLPLAQVAQLLGVAETAVQNVSVLKKGAVNCSYTFLCNGEKYVVRVPSYGIAKPAIQSHESSVYQALQGHGLADEVIHINDNTGLKISRFIDGVRQCDPFDDEDVRRCLTALRHVHEQHIHVTHRFDLFDTVNYFESLWGDSPSVYTDYQETKSAVFSLRRYIGAHKAEECLTHIDPVPENFLMGDGTVRLIDWEYAAMQDPHVDVAMFCLYSLYNRAQVDRAINLYFGGTADRETRIKIYCYMAVGGLLWSNWCESKHKGGTEFGVYALKQYRYAKEYYRIVKEELEGAL